MLSSSASVRKRVEEHARSMPSFILDSDSLDNYRPWLRRAREWARKQGGDIMEQHLIGQTVPAGALTDETLDAADAFGAEVNCPRGHVTLTAMLHVA